MQQLIRRSDSSVKVAAVSGAAGGRRHSQPHTLLHSKGLLPVASLKGPEHVVSFLEGF